MEIKTREFIRRVRNLKDGVTIVTMKREEYDPLITPVPPKVGPKGELIEPVTDVVGKPTYRHIKFLADETIPDYIQEHIDNLKIK